MNDNKKRFWTWVLFGFLSVCATIALNAAIVHMSGQVDLTQDARYTIPPALERIAQKVDKDEVLKITVYLSDSLPRYIEHLPRTISTRLGEVRRASKDRIEYEFIDPKDNVDLMQELSDKFKIAPIQLQDVREGEVTQGSYYLAMLFRYKQQIEALHLKDLGMELVKEERTLAALPGLLAARLLKVLTPPEDVVVGIASDKKQPPPSQSQDPEANKPTDGLKALRERLKNHVTIKDVVIKGGAPVPPDIKTLILYKPDALAPADVYQLDQFLMRGGRVIVMLDTVSIFDIDRLQAINQALQQDKFSLRPIETGLRDWLAFYGMNVDHGVVMDRFNHKMVRLQPVPGSPFPKQEIIDIPGLVNVRDVGADKKPTGQLEQSEMTLAGIGSLAFLLPAPMKIDVAGFEARNPASKVEPLAWTSDEAWVAKDLKDTIPFSNVTPPPREEWGRHVLVARASGPLRSYFADKEIPARPGASPDESRPSDASKITSAPKEHPAILWVVADADFAVDGWLNYFAQMRAMSAAQGLGVSATMIMNMADVSALGPDLVEIRRQRLIDRSIDEPRAKEDWFKIRFLNIALMPIVFIGFGLLWWIFRSVQTFVPSPRQPVTVPVGPPAESPVSAAAVSEKTDSHS